MNEAVRDVDQLLYGKGAFADRLIAVVLRQHTEGYEQLFGSKANAEAGTPSSNVDAVAALAVHHANQLATASTLFSVNLGRYPEAGAADAKSARSVVPLLGSKAVKSSKAKSRKYSKGYYYPGFI